MPRGKDPTQPYSHRRLDATVINTTMDTEAVELLYRYGGSGRLSDRPTVSLDVISLVASSCGYYRG